MNSFEVILPVGFLELGLGLMALGLLFGAWLSRRARIEPLGYWPLAWATLIGIGFIRVAGLGKGFEYAGTAFYCALLVAGAFRYAERPIPKHLFSITVGLALALMLLWFGGAEVLAGNLELALAPPSICFAAYVVQRAMKGREASFVHRLLPFGLILLAILGAYDHIAIERGVESFAIWLVAGVPIATNQAVAVFDRIRSRADEIAAELEESVSLLQATLESTTDGILVVGNDGRYTSYNQLFCTMWGIPDDVVSTRESEVVLQYAKNQLKDPQGFYEGVKSIYADPDSESFDALEFLDGRTIERYSRPQKVGNKNVGRVWSFRDVTARKRAEETIQRDKDHLEELVAERTRQLIESRDHLRQADRMAAIGTLAAGVAHQINNPVGAILNAAEFALLCREDDDAKDHFENALRTNVEEAKRCGAIVRGMLQFARDEPVDKLVEDLNQTIRRALRAVDAYSRDRSANFEVELCKEPLPLRMSPLEMEQVFVNVFRNAIESQSEGAVVRVRTFVEHDRAFLEVIDNGRGIQGKDRARIFDPFFSTRLHEGGTGLGLSVAHGIVMDHGGQISIEGCDGGGTRITVELPIEQGEKPGLRRASQPGSTGPPRARLLQIRSNSSSNVRDAGGTSGLRRDVSSTAPMPTPSTCMTSTLTGLPK